MALPWRAALHKLPVAEWQLPKKPPHHDSVEASPFFLYWSRFCALYLFFLLMYTLFILGALSTCCHRWSWLYLPSVVGLWIFLSWVWHWTGTVVLDYSTYLSFVIREYENTREYENICYTFTIPFPLYSFSFHVYDMTDTLSTSSITWLLLSLLGNSRN